MSDLSFLGGGAQAPPQAPPGGPPGAPPQGPPGQVPQGGPGQAIGLEAAIRVLREEVGWSDEQIAQVISDLMSYMGQQVSPEQQQQVEQAIAGAQGAPEGQPPGPTDFLRR